MTEEEYKSEFEYTQDMERASYGVSFVVIFGTIDRVITALHRICIKWYHKILRYNHKTKQNHVYIS